MSAEVVVLGSFMLDFVISAPRFAGPGETILGTGVEQHLGGKGFNPTLAAARAGASTAMVGVLGADEFGERFLGLLDEENIDRSLVRLDAAVGTGMAFPIVVTGGENSITVVPRANATFSASDVERAEELIAQSRVLLIQLELPLEPLAVATRLARRHGIPVMLNAAPAVERIDDFEIDHLVVNLSEAHLLLGADDLASADVAVRLRERYGLATVVVTLGAEGSVVADDDGVVAIAPHEVDAIDTIGAGDAYCGYLAAGLAAGESIREAALRSTVAGALATTVAGAAPSIPRRAQVDGARAH